MRDKHECNIIKAEIKSISSFQIKYYMKNKDFLSRGDLIKFKAAFEIYKAGERDK